LESVYRATYRGFKSLILRQNVGNPPEDTSDENSYAEIDDSRTIPANLIKDLEVSASNLPPHF
jgi:hypothetical protein